MSAAVGCHNASNRSQRSQGRAGTHLRGNVMAVKGEMVESCAVVSGGDDVDVLRR